MRITWPGASGGRTGSGIGDGGSAYATGAANAEIDIKARNSRTVPPKCRLRRTEMVLGSELGGQQFGDLNSVQRSAFSQVVAGHEQCQPTTFRHTGIVADPADK